MKKNIIIAILSLLVVLGFSNKSNNFKITKYIGSIENEIYSEILQVKNVNYETGEIIFQDYLGNIHLFVLEGFDDIYTTEFYTCTMYKNKTEEIYDDIILNINYERLDLWESLETIYEEYNFTGPMGYKFNYIRKLSGNEFEYKDSQTNIHYVVEKLNGQYIIKSPLFKNANLELLKTENTF